MPRRWGRASDPKEEAHAPALLECTPATGKCEACQPAGTAGYPTHKAGIRGSGSYRYYERGQNYDVHVTLADPFPQSSIPIAAAAYRLNLRALWLRRKCVSQIEAAKQLGCAARSLDDAWRCPLKEAPRPPQQVAKYIAAYEQRMLETGAEPFRAPTLKRGYAKGCAGLYTELAAALPWEQAVLRKRNYETGGVTITNIASSRQDCCFPTLHTGLPQLDAVLAKIRKDFDIQDPGAYLMCNWYLDGNTNIASHQHDFWSATLSFGAPRLFILDGQAVLLGDGDLLVFGTQRHSVPKMLEVQEGRISISVFWYPERTKADGTFTIALDPSMGAAALSSDELAEAVANAAAFDISKMPFNITGRGVGKRESRGPVDDHGDVDADDTGFLSEDRLMAIALAVSMQEQ